jgi:hypothetical protein
MQAVHAALAGAALALLISGALERQSPDPAPQHVKEATERKQDVRPEDRIALTHPLQCDAWTMRSGTPGELPRARCYQRPENR